MPDDLRFYGVEPAPESSPEFRTSLSTHGISEDEDHHTHLTLGERLKALAAAHPSANVRVVYEGRSAGSTSG